VLVPHHQGADGAATYHRSRHDRGRSDDQYIDRVPSSAKVCGTKP